MEQKKFYYVYQITNLVNGRIYVGMHVSYSLRDTYMGSGTVIKQAIAKYGLESFEKIILFEGSSIEEIATKEAEIVTSEFIQRDDTYNLREGGRGGTLLLGELEEARRKKVAESNRVRKTGSHHSEETKQRMSAAQMGRPNARKGKSKYDLTPRSCEVCGKEFVPKAQSQIKGKCCSRSCTAKLLNSRGLNVHRSENTPD